jgi:hypothetical protein
MSGLQPYDYTFLKLLGFSPFERRARGGWRFGTKRIGDDVADRLIASGRAAIEADRLHLVAGPRRRNARI